MSNKRYSHHSSEQKTFRFNSITSIIGILVAIIPISVTIWLADNAWLSRVIAIGILFFLAVIIISVYFFFYRQFFHQEMTFLVASHTPIVETKQPQQSQVNPTVFQGLEVTFNSQPEASLYLILIELRNTGHIPITLNDYNSDTITINFGTGFRILRASMKRSDDTILLQHEKEQIPIPKFESDPGDLIILRVFLASDIDIDKVHFIQPQDTKFSIRKVDSTNERNKKILERLQIAFDVITGVLFVGSLVTLYIVSSMLAQINIWGLLLFLTGITIIYLCIMVSRLFNSIISRQTKI